MEKTLFPHFILRSFSAIKIKFNEFHANVMKILNNYCLDLSVAYFSPTEFHFSNSKYSQTDWISRMQNRWLRFDRIVGYSVGFHQFYINAMPRFNRHGQK